MKVKYIKTHKYNSIIVFPIVIEHSAFQRFDPVSAGFCHIKEDQVYCYGESVSLGLRSDPQDSDIATMQFFGELSDNQTPTTDEKD